MPDSAPFQVTDDAFKNLIEGNRYGTSHIFSSENASNINIYLQLRQSNGGYIIISPINVLSDDNIRVTFVSGMNVTDNGTEIDVQKRRLDGPDSSSTAYQNASWNGGSTSPEKLALSGGSLIGANLDNQALVAPDPTDIIFNVTQVSGGGKITMGFEIVWAEVPNTIIPDLTA